MKRAPRAVARLAAGPFALILLVSPARGDVGLRPVTRDFDAEFARAADLLETGQRPEAERVLSEILRQSRQPAWEARAAFLLTGDDLKRGAFPAGIARMRAVPASSIGLEPYRHERLARLLAGGGRGPEAISHWRTALDLQELPPARVRLARSLARHLEEQDRRAEALTVLDAAADEASGAEISRVAFDRIRLAATVRRPASAAAAARDLLHQAPGADLSSGTPPAVRTAMRQEESRLSPAQRAMRGRALVRSGAARRGVALLLGTAASWPGGDRGSNLLALAQGQAALGKPADAERTAARIAPQAPEFADALLLRADLALARIRGRDGSPVAREDPRVAAVRRDLLSLTGADAARPARRAARERLVRIATEAGDFEAGLGVAAAMAREDRGTIAGFESLWQLAWGRYLAGDIGDARRRFEALAEVYEDITRDRRLAYWRARCLEREGRAADAAAILSSLAGADPPDVHALFARRRVRGFRPVVPDPLPDPSTETARYRRVDELLRVRMFEEAALEARALEPTRGRDLRVAEAEFALGRFAAAAAAVKRAFPQIGTSEEGRVPDGWRRLHYPLPFGEDLDDAARDFQVDAGLLRGLVRQESVFDAGARSRAGAIGLTQIMPATAKALVRSVLRVRYRRAFLYDPDVNARLGAAYLAQLLRRFNGSAVYALAAYNGGPTRMTRIIRENAGRPEDEVLESHPFYETREYVRRVLLYAASYRKLYPG